MLINLILCFVYGLSGAYWGLRWFFYLRDKELEAKQQALLSRLNRSLKH